MSKYIDAMAAADKIRELVVHFGKHSQMGQEFLSGAEAAAEALRYMPPADVAPAVHGRWDKMDGYKMRRICSACGWDVPEYGKFYSYCPNCGARMDEHDKSNNDN